jgi:hypothetical protein
MYYSKFSMFSSYHSLLVMHDMTWCSQLYRGSILVHGTFFKALKQMFPIFVLFWWDLEGVSICPLAVVNQLNFYVFVSASSQV